MTRQKFFQDSSILSYSQVSKMEYDLLFYWMFYHINSNPALSKATGETKEIYDALQAMPRKIQTNLIMKILTDTDEDQSKKVKAVVKLYS